MTKYLFCRRIMFIGEYKGDAVYLDLKKNIPLKAPKSALLNTEKARACNKWTFFLSMLITIVLGVIGVSWVKNSDSNNMLICKVVFLISTLISILLYFILKRGLYKNVKKAKPTTRKVFASAMKNSNAWEINKGYGKIKFKVWFLWGLIFITLPAGVIFFINELYRGLYINQYEFFREYNTFKEIVLGAPVGLPLFLVMTYYIYHMFNPIVFFHIASKYQKRKLFGKEVDKLVEEDKKMKSKILPLPLGSVVLLKDGDGTLLEIVCRGTVIEEDYGDVYYDYGAVLIPDGLVAPEAVYFFNHENIDSVVFRGFENDAEKKFADSYDEMMQNSGIEKGTVD